MKVRNVIRLIEDAGWYFERQRDIPSHAARRGSVTVDGKPGQDMLAAGLRKPKQ